MSTRRSRRLLRDGARMLTALSGVMLLTSVWLTIDPEADPASAAATGGAARIVHPSTSPNAGELLQSGGSDTDFVLELPLGAACSGDNATDGYLVHSYMVPAAIEPADITFGPGGATPTGTGDAFRQPLWDTNGSQYAAEFPDIDTATISGVPVFDFTVYGEAGPEGGAAIVPEGTYNAGIACVAPPEGDGSWTLDRYWNVQLSFLHDAEDLPSGLTWTVASPQAVTTSLALAATPEATAPVGSEVTLTATVTPPEAEGTVAFLDGTTELDVAAVAAGSATTQTSALPAGTRDLTAVFTPTDETAFSSSTAAIQYVVTAGATSVALTADPPSTAVVGTPVTITATLVPAEAVGTLTFRDGDQVLSAEPVTVSAGAGTFTADALTEGEHSFAAEFTPAPDSGFEGATSDALPYTVTAVPTVTVTLRADPTAEAAAGDDVTLTASVSPSTATGTITFLDDGDALEEGVALDGGEASVIVDDLPVGEHELTAAFSAADDSGLEDATSVALAYEIVAAATTTTTTTTTTSAPSTPSSAPPAAPIASPDAGGPTGSGGLTTLPMTGGPASVAGWGVVLLIAGRAAALLGRSPAVTAAVDER